MQRDRLSYILLPAVGLIAVLPLILQGCSCGHDFDFHLLSWMEAARQFTHGNLHPHWAYTPAYNAGEPRFVFYPPLSWTLGALLGLVLPWAATPIVYTWLTLTACGFALYRLARKFASPTASLVAAAFYTVNPYMLFTAYERTAYSELLAAVWIPLLLHSILGRRVTIPGIAVPVALLWITNAPAAVMSCYALALLALLRVVAITRGTPRKDLRTWISSRPRDLKAPLQLALTTTAGTALGLGLAAFYIIPAAYERRFVQIAMAIIPSLRAQDNFLFHHIGDAAHDQVLHTVSLIALILLIATVTALAIACLHRRTYLKRNSFPLPALAILVTVITLLLTPLTAPVWNHAPELAFLQFPWRLLAILAAVLGLTAARALSPLNLRAIPAAALAVTLSAALTYPAYTLFHLTCGPDEAVAAREILFHSNRGADPTDEYTPNTADNDSLSQLNPPFWLSTNPDAKAPTHAIPGKAPSNLHLTSPAEQTLILNLRDYPAWRITLNHALITTREEREDGLVAIPIPTGPSTVSIAYAQSSDQTTGDIVTVLSIALLLLIIRRERLHRA